MITKHPIYLDFPEFADKIKDLYHHNDEFQVLVHSYTELDEKIYKIETDEELAMDDELSQLRKDRVFLKDEIYNFLKNNQIDLVRKRGCILSETASFFYNKVFGQTYSVLGNEDVFAISLNPPVTSTKLSYPLCFKIEAAIILR